MHSGARWCTFFSVVACLSFVTSTVSATAARSDEDYFRGQTNYISVIMATHNDARYITSVLESVEESIELFLRERKATKQSSVGVQLIIVDDNSEDDTALKVHRFIKHRKAIMQTDRKKVEEALWVNRSDSVPYPGSQFYMNEVKNLMVELHSASRIGLGTAFNLGVEYATGEILYFIDGRGLVSKHHVRDCYNALVSSTNAYARAGISFTRSEQMTIKQSQSDSSNPSPSPSPKPVEQELETERSVVPNNLCVWRKVHNFIEGFPESSVWDDYPEEVGQAYLSLLDLGFPWSAVPSPAIELHSSSSRNPGSPSGKHEASKDIVRDRLIKAHVDHLKNKLIIYKKGGEPEERDKKWRIQANALKVTNVHFTNIHKMETRSPRLRSMLSLADELFKQGDTIGTAAAYNVTSELTFNKKNIGRVGTCVTSSKQSWPSSQQFLIDDDPWTSPSGKKAK